MRSFSRLALLSAGLALSFLSIPLSAAAAPGLLAELKNSFAALPAEPAAAADAATTTTPAPAIASDPDLIALTRPAIVRIVVHFSGTTTVPDIEPNFNTLTWTVNPSGATTPLPYDQYLLGSGFVVNPNGYIVTNAHVVSPTTVATVYAAAAIEEDLLHALFSISIAESNAISHKYSTAQIQQFTLAGIDFFESHVSFASPTVAVLKATVPALATTTSALQIEVADTNQTVQAAALIASGTPATVVYVNNQYQSDEKDVAVLKVNETDLPAIRLSSSAAVAVGDPVYAFGFPANADRSALSTEPTFTSGTVNAFKSSEQNTFQYIQTDTADSEGSSGSPIFDAQAEVVGIVDQESNEVDQNGSPFTFGLPIDLATNVLVAQGIATSTPGDYVSDYLAGRAYEDARQCKKAIVEYQAAETANPVFTDVSTYVAPRISECEALIASGQSLDSFWDVARNQLGALGWMPIALVGLGVLVLIALFFGGLWLLRRLRREERLVESLEQEVEHPPRSAPAAVPASAPAAQSMPTTPAPSLADFVRITRAKGASDEQLRATLLGAGWPIAQIEEALRV